ncbi:U3 small nucleolar RNA-associated protein 14 homolog A [Hippoglossus hippoglossus]|uniref:U3 small nucleolar RNA-associated protein 14 homolog A n=1 Tax=Hippoglossus hippoglossus TaxID=8267 RepID=UPI00148D1738|nr:U3 small nucleolar RNA-associated protein 14 homolog A [Hippoglossus hippoglossus]
MAKMSKTKAISSKRVKKSCEGPEKKKHVVYDEEEERLNEADVNFTSEEEEEDDGHNDERKRQKLLEAINALGVQRKKKLAERSEASVYMSDFTVTAEGEGDKMDLSELIGTVDKNPAVPAKTKKQLKNLEQSKKTIECSLSKQESERIQRDVAFQKASTEVSKWKGVIKQNQRAEQLLFPLNQEPTGPKAMERVVTSWKVQTPLEQEVFALLSANKQPINDPILTPAEEASLSAMSLEEAKIRRAELQKARALQSYYEAKARRERKIKSKKYHKVHNKAKRKDFLKQFDEMIKTNPAAAIEELNKVELARMQERMSLKHQNSGKWAKSNAIISKYDKGARKAMQQQLEVNKELTQKLVTSLNNEGEEEEVGSPELIPDFVNDTEGGLDSSNPWMRGKLSEQPTERSDIFDLTEEGAGVVGNKTEEDNYEEVEETAEEALLREFDHRRKLRLVQEAEIMPVIFVDHDNKAAAEYTSNKEEEEEQLSEFTSLFQVIANSRQAAEAVQADAAEDAKHTDSAQLEEGQRIRTQEDVEFLSQELSTDKAPVQPQPVPATEKLPSATLKAGKNRKRKRGTELKEILTTEAKVIQVPIAPAVEDTEDSDEKLEQRGLIKEAFAGDDVMSDFLRDKRNQEDAGRPKVVDLTLPGWGEWGGGGLKPSRNKRRRFRIKTVLPPPRKDQHLPSVIISEKRNSSISLHQVNSLPFPFENHMQFESTVRSPVGRTWNTEHTVKKITKPKVITQLGSIIEPMAREELVKDKKLVCSVDNK